MNGFLHSWAEAAMTTLGFFWMALWAFCLGYIVSSMIQVFVTRQRMKQAMGEAGPRSVALGAFFGFISSSCSFAALSTSRSLFQKGAGLVPALAFLLASTNLVIELGIVILIFLPWQFVVGEYLGGLILILVMWVVVSLTLPRKLEDASRQHAREAGGGSENQEQVPDWKQRIRSRHGWHLVGRRYFMEWGMVWKDVTFGFTVAGVIAAFVPPIAFEALFVGSGGQAEPTWWQTVLHTLIGPLAAFFTFIGSMGNIPLAGVLFASGVSYAGVMAFIFSDLVVFPVLRISASYFGWRMAVYILGVFLICLVAASLTMHYGLSLLGMLPEHADVTKLQLGPTDRFSVDYTLLLNMLFLTASAVLAWLARRQTDNGNEHQHHNDDGRSWTQWLLLALAVVSLVWLAAGVVLWFM